MQLYEKRDGVYDDVFESKVPAQRSVMMGKERSRECPLAPSFACSLSFRFYWVIEVRDQDTELYGTTKGRRHITSHHHVERWKRWQTDEEGD